MYILMRNRAILRLCPEDFSDSEYKGNELIHLADDVLREPNIQALLYDLCSLLLALFTARVSQKQSRKMCAVHQRDHVCIEIHSQLGIHPQMNDHENKIHI